ncbi:hypothetical protein B0H11DRAFT_1904608 [Mycena galericulata]|nr:hypothetical protein B0H11DRAFT_1904608 [Mycena galericulata]
MSADIVLCRSGGLDLNTPVDPLRWKPFHPTHPNYLSPVAIQVLSQDHGCIKFIEPTVSHQTLMQRQMREVILGVAALVQLICLRAFEMFSQCLEADTPFPRLYRRLRLHVKQVQQISLAWKWEEVFNVVILAIWVTLVVALLGGYIHIAPRERARNWVRTGSLSL